MRTTLPPKAIRLRDLFAPLWHKRAIQQRGRPGLVLRLSDATDKWM